MPTVLSPLYYSAPLTPTSRDDDWCIDAVSRPPDVLFNFRKVPTEMIVTDLREGAIEPRLDDTGFEKMTAPNGADQRALLVGSSASIAEYQRETAALLKSRIKADEVLFFDATLRQEGAGAYVNSSSQSAHQRVHVDQTPKSARARAASHWQGGRFRRFQIINIWRPLIEPVRNFPLAMCDYQSVNAAADLVVTKLRFPAWLEDRENYSVRHNSRHRWYYWHSLSPDEALIFKCYDSASRNLAVAGGDTERGDLLDVAGLCPHTAFFDAGGPAKGHLRISIEMRALAFYY
jgi:cephamycin C biosynthesis protein